MSETTAPEKGVVRVKIEDEMRGAYLDYAMSVIIGRALPDVRDGLKPVHRRILYAMYDLGNTHDKPYKKSARVVGDVIGKYHPHGDTAVYDTIVRMAQDFSMRAPLIDGQGNFGSVDGDTAAAMRYTEIRMERITNDLLEDIEKETVDFGPNYDDTLKEPLVLPTRVPNLLLNGSGGIAVGMATNIPPHNLGEIVDATVALIKDPSLETNDLFQYVKGPDFPTGGLVFGGSGLRKAYLTGRSVITIRGRAEIEEAKNDRERIVITELPYQVNKAKLVEKIVELVKEKKIEGISDLRDESDRSGMRVVIELKKGENANVILNNLYKFTQLQESFGISLLAIHQNRPKIFNLRDMLWAFVEHRKDVVLRRTAFELRKAEARAHILEGLKRAVENLDEVIALIKGSANPATAKIALMDRFEFSELQAQAILDMRLHRLTGLEREKIVEEYNEILKLITRLREILASEKLVYEIIEQELEDVKRKYANKRRTEITIADAEDFDTEDLIADDETLVTLTHKGYIKRQDVNQFRSQHRGGKGIRAMATGEGDFVNAVFRTTNLTNLLCFTSAGRMYSLKVYKIPEASRESKGKAIINLVQLQPGELVKAVLPVREFEEDKFIVFVTRQGTVKRTPLSEFRNVRQAGIIAIGLEDKDELVGAKLTNGKSDVFLCSKQGMSIRFHEDDARAMGRSARGVNGINLEESDVVVGLGILDPSVTDAEILTVSERGYGKRTPVSEYKVQNRGGKGLITGKLTDKTGGIVGVCQVTAKDDLMVISDEGQMIRINVGEISEMGRNTQGVRVMNVGDGEKVVAMEHLAGDESDSGNESAKVFSNGAGADSGES